MTYFSHSIIFTYPLQNEQFAPKELPGPKKERRSTLQESYNAPLEHTRGNPLANYERNPFVACW